MVNISILSMSILSQLVNTVKEVVMVARSTAQGMSVTLSHIPTKKETVSYPEEAVQIYRRFRGDHFLDVNEDGADAIYIEGAEDQRPYEQRIGMDHRYAKIYQIDYGRCILCGFCVDACPTDAINHGHNFEWACYTPGEMVKDKEYLLANKWREPDVIPTPAQRPLAAKQKMDKLNIVLK
jgi:NADH-quinone oxidoreductase subunit I